MDNDTLVTLTLRKSTLGYLAPFLLAVPNVGGVLSYLRADDAADRAVEARDTAQDARDTSETALTFAFDEDEACSKWAAQKLMERLSGAPGGRRAPHKAGDIGASSASVTERSTGE